MLNDYMSKKRVINFFIIIFILITTLISSTFRISADNDLETDQINLKYNVTLSLDYEDEYVFGNDWIMPDSALINEIDENIDIDSVDVLFNGINGTVYESSDFPNKCGDYSVTWTIKRNNDYYIGSGFDTFSINKAQIESPTSTFDSGELTKGTRISLECEEKNAEIYYSIDNSEPTKESFKYIDSICIEENMTIKAKAFIDDDYKCDSDISTYIYTVIDDTNDFGDILDEDFDNNWTTSNDVPNGLWTNDIDNVTYTGKALTPTVRVYNHTELLTLNKDYTIKYSNNTKAGIASILISGKGNYLGTYKTSFKINPIVINSDNTTLTINKNLFISNGKVQKATVSSVIYKDDNGKSTKLKANTDYVVQYEDINSSLPGSYSISISGKGNYVLDNNIDKSIKQEYVITNKIPMTSVTVSKITDKIWSEDGYKPTPTITIKTSQLTKTLAIGDDYTLSYDSDTISAGTHNLTITAKEDSDFYGSVTKTYKILGTSISSYSVTGLLSSVSYTGEEICFENLSNFKVSKVDKKTGENILVNGVDYSIEYQNNINIGKATMIITGKGKYIGTIKKTFNIVGKKLTDCIVEEIPKSIEYNGENIEPTITIKRKDNSELLTKDIDYRVDYQKNKDVGTATTVITGINGYTGTIKKTFKITAIPLNTLPSNVLSIEMNSSYTYLKGGVKVEPIIKINGGTPLVLNKDYTLSYKNNTIISTLTKKAIVTIKGKGNYSGSINKEYTITCGDISDLNISITDKVVSTKANQYKSTPTVVDLDGKTLKAGTDYDKNIEYRYKYLTFVTNSKTKLIEKRNIGDVVQVTDIIPTGTIILVKIKGINSYANSSTTISYSIVNLDVSSLTITIPTQYYTGKAIYLTKNDLIVKNKKIILSEEEKNNNIEIISYSNNIYKGTATVTIKGKGLYGGIKTIKFNIAAKTITN